MSSDGEAARVIVHHRNVLHAATPCGVGHVVLLSGLDVALDSPFCYAFTNGDTRHHDVTGPDSLPVDAIAAAAGYRYTDTTPADFAGTLLHLGEHPLRPGAPGDVNSATNGHIPLWPPVI